MRRDPLDLMEKQIKTIWEHEVKQAAKAARAGGEKAPIAEAYDRGKLFAYWRVLLLIEELRSTELCKVGGV